MAHEVGVFLTEALLEPAVARRPERDLSRLLERLARVGVVLQWPEDRLYVRIESVSAWSPAQHVDHVQKSLEAFLDRIERLERGTDPAIRPDGRPTVWGRAILITGWIPRGRGEAPATVLPDPRPVLPRMRATSRALEARADALAPRAAGLTAVPGVLAHPLLGAFDAPAWLRFADLHTRHHLAILADIDRHRAIGARVPAPGPGDEPEFGVSPEAP